MAKKAATKAVKAPRPTKTYTIRLTDGTEIVVNSVQQMREVVGELPDRVAAAHETAKPKKAPRRPRNFKSPGIGPKRFWSLAMLHAAKSDLSKDNARREVSELKKTDKLAFAQAEDERIQFVEWYRVKYKMPDEETALDSLATLFDEKRESFNQVVKSFPKSAARRRAGQ